VPGDDIGVIEDAKHGRHHKVARREASFEIWLLAKMVRQPSEPRFDHFDDLGPAFAGPIAGGVEQVDQRQLLDHRLDAVERRQHPRHRAGATQSVGGQQGFAFLADMEHDRPALEHPHRLVAVARHLTKRLIGEIVRGPLRSRAEFAHGIGDARLLERPAHAQVAHLPASEVGHPRKGADLNWGSVIDGHPGILFDQLRSGAPSGNRALRPRFFDCARERVPLQQARAIGTKIAVRRVNGVRPIRLE